MSFLSIIAAASTAAESAAESIAETVAETAAEVELSHPWYQRICLRLCHARASSVNHFNGDRTCCYDCCSSVSDHPYEKPFPF